MYDHIPLSVSASRKSDLKFFLPGLILGSRHKGWDSGAQLSISQQAMKTPTLVVSGVLIVLRRVTAKISIGGEMGGIQVYSTYKRYLFVQCLWPFRNSEEIVIISSRDFGGCC